MNIDDISTQLLYTTIRLEVHREDSATVFATAFIISLEKPDDPKLQIPFLVTPAHAVKSANAVKIHFVAGRDGFPTQESLTYGVIGPVATQFVDSEIDIALIPIGTVVNHLNSNAQTVFYKSVTSSIIPTTEQWTELAAIEEITFIGYPSGIFDMTNSSPIVRRGITATPVWNNFEGKPNFLIDAGVFPGSSGSPVFILNRGAYPTKEGLNVGTRLLFLGMVTSTLQRKEDGATNVYLGLGSVVNANALLSFAKKTMDELLQRNR